MLNIDATRAFPAFTAVATEGEQVRLKVFLKETRAVCKPCTDDPDGYVTGIVDSINGEKKVVFAFLRSEDVIAILSSVRKVYDSASLEGIWDGHVVGMGFFLRDCTFV